MPWYEIGPGPTRLEHDRQIVRQEQPELRYAIQPDKALWLVGDFVVVTASAVPHRIPIQIRFPTLYPRHEPTAHDHSGRFIHDWDHHFIDDRVCLWHKLESKWHRGDPDALHVFLDELTISFIRLLAWESDPSIGYPGPARPHGYLPAMAAILAERLALPTTELWKMTRALTEDLPRATRCPCGQSRTYGACHRRAIADFRGLVGATDMKIFVDHLWQQRRMTGGSTSLQPSPVS